MLPFPVELLRFLENNTSLTSTLSATQSAVAKVTNASASSGRSGVADMALGARGCRIGGAGTDNRDRRAVHTANGLSPVTNGRSTGSEAG